MYAKFNKNTCHDVNVIQLEQYLAYMNIRVATGNIISLF